MCLPPSLIPVEAWGPVLNFLCTIKLSSGVWYMLNKYQFKIFEGSIIPSENWLSTGQFAQWFLRMISFSFQDNTLKRAGFSSLSAEETEAQITRPRPPSERREFNLRLKAAPWCHMASSLAKRTDLPAQQPRSLPRPQPRLLAYGSECSEGKGDENRGVFAFILFFFQ